MHFDHQLHHFFDSNAEHSFASIGFTLLLVSSVRPRRMCRILRLNCVRYQLRRYSDDFSTECIRRVFASNVVVLGVTQDSLHSCSQFIISFLLSGKQSSWWSWHLRTRPKTWWLVLLHEVYHKINLLLIWFTVERHQYELRGAEIHRDIDVVKWRL